MIVLMYHVSSVEFCGIFVVMVMAGLTVTTEIIVTKRYQNNHGVWLPEY